MVNVLNTGVITINKTKQNKFPKYKLIYYNRKSSNAKCYKGKNRAVCVGEILKSDN